jgi:hypothetical protein
MEMVRKSHESMACAMPRPGAILWHDLLMSSMLVGILVLPTCRTILTLEELRCHAQNNDPTNCSRVPLKKIVTYYWGTQAQQASKAPDRTRPSCSNACVLLYAERVNRMKDIRRR